MRILRKSKKVSFVLGLEDEIETRVARVGYSGSGFSKERGGGIEWARLFNLPYASYRYHSSAGSAIGSALPKQQNQHAFTLFPNRPPNLAERASMLILLFGFSCEK